MELKSFCAVACACFVVAIAHGQTPDSPPPASAPPIDRAAGMSIESMRAAFQTRFDRLDSNGDGFLSKAEFDEPRQRNARNQRGSGDGEDRTGVRARVERPRQRSSNAPPRQRSFEDLDADNDGQISKEEMSAPMERLVALDANGDGRLDPTEMEAMRQLRSTANQEP